MIKKTQSLTEICKELNLNPATEKKMEAADIFDRIIDRINDNTEPVPKNMFTPTIPTEQEFTEEMARALELFEFLTLEKHEGRKLPKIEFQTGLFTGQIMADIINLDGLPITNYSNGLNHKFYII